MSDAPKRRWPRYSLRTLFVVVTVAACWMGYEVNWIRQRHEFIVEAQLLGQLGFHYTKSNIHNERMSSAGIMALFGAEGYSSLNFGFKLDTLAALPQREGLQPLSRESPHGERLRRAHILFPEAKIYFFGYQELNGAINSTGYYDYLGPAP